MQLCFILLLLFIFYELRKCLRHVYLRGKGMDALALLYFAKI